MRLGRILALVGAFVLAGMMSPLSLASEGGQSDRKVHADRGYSDGRAGERVFRTNRGREYYGCEIIGRDPHGVTFRHRGGVAKLAYIDLPKSEQVVFGYDRKKAREFVRHYYPRPVTPRRVVLTSSNATRQGAIAAYPRRRGRSHGHGFRNPYSLNGPIANISAYGSVFGGYLQPYFAGRFGTPRLVRSVPGGFFTPNTLRVGARPIVGSPIAPAMTSFSQLRDVRAGAVRAAVRATSRAVLHRHSGGGHRHGGGHR